MLAPALRRNRRDRAFNQFKQRLLHALAGHIAGNRRVVGLARNLVDFVDVDDAELRLLDFIVAGLQQFLDDVLDILADITGLGQRGGVGHGERHIELARQRFRQQRFAGAGGADEQNIALGDVHLVGLALVLDPLVVVVDRHRQGLLGVLLADDITVQDFMNLGRSRRMPGVAALRRALAVALLADDFVAQVNALVADKHRRPGD